MFQLSEGEKILVLAVCLSLVAVTVVITVCVVAPSCYLHLCLKRIAKKRKLKYANAYGLEEGTYIKMTGTPHYTVECGPLNKVTTTVSDASQPGRTGRKREDSSYSSMSTSSQGNASVSNCSEASVDTPVVDLDQEMNYGQLTFSVRCRELEDGTPGQLIVFVKEAQYLPPRGYGSTCDPYLMVRLVRDKRKKRWSKPNATVLYEYRTATKRKTQHPLYREYVAMDITKSDLKENALKFLVFDEEKYANDSELGEVSIPLRELAMKTLKWDNTEKYEDSAVTLDFQEPKQERGELLFGISYLPTAERLTFSIVKASNLHVITSDVQSFAPYIRVLLMHNGKQLKKKKTSARTGTASPAYNESLTFDVPPSQLDKIDFLLVASHREESEGIISSPDSPTSPQTALSKKGRHIGKVVIGSSARGLSFSHWNAMKQSPRKQVTQWHTLR